MAVNGSTAFGATKIESCGKTCGVERMVDSNRFGVNHKAEAAQTEKAGESDQKGRHFEIVDQAAHESSGDGSKKKRNPYGQERVASSSAKAGQ